MTTNSPAGGARVAIQQPGADHPPVLNVSPRPQKSAAHPGVWIVNRKRGGGVLHFSRWVDPDTKRRVEIVHETLGHTSERERRRWRITKSRTLLDRKSAIGSGAVPSAATAVGDAIDEYLDAAIHRLSPDTVRTYRESLRRFSEWASSENVTPPHLARLHAQIARRAKLHDETPKMPTWRPQLDDHEAWGILPLRAPTCGRDTEPTVISGLRAILRAGRNRPV